MKPSSILLLFILVGCGQEQEQIEKLPFISKEPIEFTGFLNQDSISVNSKTYKGKIWVAEFFFASCPTICPIMNREMKILRDFYEKSFPNMPLQFLSFSIDPSRDTPSVLNNHKNQLCESCTNWDFLTGEEEKTHRLGIQDFKIFAGKDEEAQGGYAHSGAFSLVDKKGFVRGVYNITDFNGLADKNEVLRLKSDINKLMKHE